jgi:uncharacterized oligopeptide transporter (OPT) family protein
LNLLFVAAAAGMCAFIGSYESHTFSGIAAFAATLVATVLFEQISERV